MLYAYLIPSHLSTEISDPKLRSAAVRGLQEELTADFASNPLHVSCSNPLGQRVNPSRSSEKRDTCIYSQKSHDAIRHDEV